MKKKFLKISIIVMLFVLILATVVNALSFTAEMTPSSTTVAESTEFMVEVKVSNLDVGSNGINSLAGYLKYDTSVFETITDVSIEGKNGWSPTYNPENGKITLTKTTFVKTEEAVFQVNFKTKAGVSGKTGEISYKTIVASNSQAEISASDVSTKITVGDATSAPTNTNTNTNTPSIVARPTNNTTPTNRTLPTNNTTNTNTSGNVTPIAPYVNNTNTSSNEDIPYTGVEDTIMYMLIVVLALAIIFYIKFECVNREMK